MKWNFKKAPTKLEVAIDDLFSEMSYHGGSTEEYAAMVQQMDVLYKLQTVDSEKSQIWKIKPDTLVLAVTNLLGIIVIVGYEQKSVLTTKALTLLRKSA